MTNFTAENTASSRVTTARFFKTTAFKTAAFVAMTAFAFASAAQAEKITGRMVASTGAFHGTGSTFFTLNIDEHTSDEEMGRLMETLAEDGSRALEMEMTKIDHGRFRTSNGVSHRVSAVRTHEEDGQKVVRVVIDRPIAFAEYWHSTRSKDYPYTIIEIRLDEDGRGEGTMYSASKIELDEEGRIEVEHRNSRPTRLVSIRSQA